MTSCQYIIVEEDEAPPVVRGLAVIDDEGYVSMGTEGALIIKVRPNLFFLQQ